MTAERVTYIENTHEDVKWVSPDCGWYTNIEAFIIRDNGEIRPLPPQPRNSHLVCRTNDGDVPVTPIATYPYSREDPEIGFTSDDETRVFQGDQLVERYDETGLDTTEECEAFLEACLTVAHQFAPFFAEAERDGDMWKVTVAGYEARADTALEAVHRAYGHAAVDLS